MRESCLWLLDVGLVVNPFSACTQPSILESERRRANDYAQAVWWVEGSFTKRPKAIFGPYISRWRANAISA